MNDWFFYDAFNIRFTSFVSIKNKTSVSNSFRERAYNTWWRGWSVSTWLNVELIRDWPFAWTKKEQQQIDMDVESKTGYIDSEHRHKNVQQKKKEIPSKSDPACRSPLYQKFTNSASAGDWEIMCEKEKKNCQREKKVLITFWRHSTKYPANGESFSFLFVVFYWFTQ